MGRRHAAGALVLVLTSAPLGADNARPRDEGSTSSASSGAHHEASSLSSSSSSSASSSRDTSSGNGSSPSYDLSEAQQRHPRPGTGHGTRGYSYGYYSPYDYEPWNAGYSGAYPYSYGGYSP